MSYHRQLGFTPEQESEILATTKSTREYIEAQDRTRMLIVAGTLAGFLYTLAQFGEMTHRFRTRRREGSA